MVSLLVALALSPSVRAAPADSPAPQASSDDDSEGTLWDYVETGGEAKPARIGPIRKALQGRRVEAEARSAGADEEEEDEIEVPAGDWSMGAPPTIDAADVAAFYEDPVQALTVEVGTAAVPPPIEGDPLYLSLVDPSEFDIPIEVNDSVVAWMKYFTGSGRKWYARWLSRSTAVRPLMYEKLDAAGAPRDLVYLSMIESGYSTAATSTASAVGLWQFIAPTARIYGLRVDYWVDERRDPEMAADAAIHFLTDLKKKFGHWYLAWAAYNGGPARVDRAVARHGTSDFWTLSEKDSFHSETDNYVPKIIAAAIIGKHPERYGFVDIEYQDPVEYDVVEIGPNVSIDVLAKCSNLSEDEFRALNPHLRRFAVPPEEGKHHIHVPRGTQSEFLAALDAVPVSERLTFTQHRVNKGETLGVIARKYGVSVGDIQKANQIRNPNVISVGSTLVIPVGGHIPEATTTALASTTGGSRAASSRSSSSKTTTTTHTVRKGEALSSIATKYGVSTADLMRANHISNQNRIYAGQKLKITTQASSWTTYTVRKGDSLGAIAKKHGCSVEDLKSWNKLSGNTIHPGQKLTIRR